MYSAWSRRADVHQLAWRDNKKELEPRFFDQSERNEFNKSDLAERRKWILNGAVERVPHGIEKDMPLHNIMSAPMKYVRTNKGSADKLEAKSRLLIPGHTGPQIGQYRRIHRQPTPLP